MNMNNLDPFNMQDAHMINRFNELFEPDIYPNRHAPAGGGGNGNNGLLVLFQVGKMALKLIPIVLFLGFKLVKGMFHILQAIHRHR